MQLAASETKRRMKEVPHRGSFVRKGMHLYPKIKFAFYGRAIKIADSMLMSTPLSTQNLPELPPNVVARDFSVVPGPVENWFTLLPVLVVQGMSTEMCASKLGVSVEKIKAARSTARFAKLLTEEAQNRNNDAIPDMLSAFAVDALIVLATIMNDQGVGPGVRLNAAKEILERHCGKAPLQQKVKDKGILGEFHSNDPAEIAKMLDRQIDSQLEQRGKNPN